ncbi:MAG: acyloxyacyl hydrolase [Ignavibacteria bacterium]|nr:acyloxyacyl hydrolase [Ignavibacteria bacterium]
MPFYFFSDTYAQDKNYITLSSAVFDILQQDNLSSEWRIEFRFNKIDWQIKPFGGVMANTDGAVYLFSGFYIDIPLSSFLYITPSFAPGFYHKCDSKNLDFALEFRSQLELSIRLENSTRVGVSFNHISNASLGKINPGVESIAVIYYFPI